MALRCFLFGHIWRWRLVDLQKHAALAHLSGVAGTLSTCRRCQEQIDDLSDEAREHCRSVGRYPLEA